MNREPSEEGRPSPAKYMTPAIAADTVKDFFWEIGNACPAIKPYLERLQAADDAMRIARLTRFDGKAVGFGEHPQERWLRLYNAS